MQDNKKIASLQQMTDPGNGKRTPGVWGSWLTSLRGMNRQTLNALTQKETAKPGSVYYGTADAAKVAKRRAKNKVARRSRRVNRMNRS